MSLTKELKERIKNLKEVSKPRIGGSGNWHFYYTRRKYVKMLLIAVEALEYYKSRELGIKAASSVGQDALAKIERSMNDGT